MKAYAKAYVGTRSYGAQYGKNYLRAWAGQYTKQYTGNRAYNAQYASGSVFYLSLIHI